MKKQVIEKFEKKYYLLGTRKEDNKKVWLEEGHFDCNWYWGTGYVEIFNTSYTDIEEHTHFDSLFLETNIYDSFKDYFKETTLCDNEIWVILELMKTIYQLRHTSDTIHQKGSYITESNTEKHIFNEDIYKKMYDKINNEDIPRLLEEVYKLLRGEENE